MLAILCGVAVGLTSVAVGVILVVRNRSGGGAEEANEGGGGSGGSSGDSIGSGCGADGRGKYDVVATKEGDALCRGGRAAARCGELVPAIISAMETMSPRTTLKCLGYDMKWPSRGPHILDESSSAVLSFVFFRKLRECYT